MKRGAGEMEWKGVSESSRSESIERVGQVERMDEYSMTTRVLIAEVSGGRVRGRPDMLDGWCEGGLGQQRNASGGCAIRLERFERVESSGTYVTE